MQLVQPALAVVVAVVALVFPGRPVQEDLVQAE
jgi:hypothetical protein